MSVYQFNVQDSQGNTVSMSDFKDKVILIVNTASKCGFTGQYEGLESLHEAYADKGLVILGFPCNQFGGQEPGSDEDIQQFCKLNYDIKFPVLKKIEVNGENTDPLYSYLKEKAPGLLGSKKIKWNFTKFLIGKDGEVITRFAPTTTPKEIEKEIQKYL